MHIDPIELLANDRAVARREQDPMVDRCVLGTATRRGAIAMRTLVLRDINDRLALFYSASSAKHVELLTADGRASLLIYLPTVGVQYRMEARLEALPRATIASHWQFKPNAAKRMDALYERMPQSSIIDDFDSFKTLFAAAAPPVKAPLNGTGCYVEPHLIERLELRTDPAMHDRKLFTRRDNDWHVRQLVP